MFAFLDRFTLSTKIFGLVGFLLTGVILMGGTTVVQLGGIGEELEGIAERDVPLTTLLTNVTLHQLEQTILLERGARLGESLAGAHSKAVEEEFATIHKHFTELSHQVDKEIVLGEEMLAKFIVEANTAEARTEFEHVLSVLKKVEHEHKVFEQQSEQLLSMLENGEITGLDQAAHTIEAQADQIDHELGEILKEVEAFTAAAVNTATAHELAALWSAVILGLVTLVVGGGVAYLVTQRIVSSVNDLTQATQSLADGDLQTDVPDFPDNTEVGKMSASVEVFRQNLIEAEQLREEQEKIKAAESERRRKDREEKAAEEARKAEELRQQQQEAEERAAHLSKICSDFETSVHEILASLAAGATELEQTAGTMNENAAMTQEQAGLGASASTQASANVQTVASAAEELSASIAEIARQVTDSSAIANSGAGDAEAANQKVRTLAESANSIGEVIDLISDIANQTNLLSLNATIEAARAGDAGKGFAVVASEVKNLAGQTERATEDIRTQIEAIQSRTEDAVQAIETITDVIGKINETSGSIASAVEEQGAATQDIAQSVEEAALGTTQVSSSIEEVSQAATQTGAAASQVLSTSNELAQRSNQLQKHVEDFLSKLQAA